MRLFLSLVLASSLARAEPMIWLVGETRVPLQTTSPYAPRMVRVLGEARLAPTTDNVDELQFRVGALWDAHEHLLLALNAMAGINDDPAGIPAHELRLEFEPNIRGRLGDIEYNDRNRLEFRFINGEQRWRYRNQLRLNWKPEGAVWIPFVSEEILVDLSGRGFNQNRALVGLGWAFQPNTRFDIGFMIRSRLGVSEWANDYVAWFQLLFTPKSP